MNIHFANGYYTSTVTLTCYSRSGSALKTGSFSGEGTFTPHVNTYQIGITVGSDVDTSSSQWFSHFSNTKYSLSENIQPNNYEWPAVTFYLVAAYTPPTPPTPTTSYSWDCYDLTSGTYISGYEHNNVTSSSITRPLISGYTYQGYVYHNSWSNCVSAGQNNRYDGTGSTCSDHSKSYPFVVFFYTKDSSSSGNYSWDCYDLTSGTYISGYEHNNVTSSSITRPSISGYIYQGYVYHSSWSNCESAGKNGKYDGTDDTCSDHSKSYPYIVFFYTQNSSGTIYYYGDYDITNNQYLKEMKSTSSQLRSTNITEYSEYCYVGKIAGQTKESIFTALKNISFSQSIASNPSYDNSSLYVLFVYRYGWQNPYLQEVINLDSSTKLLKNLDGYYYRATYLKLYIPAHTSMIFETTIQDSNIIGNYDPYGQIYKDDPSEHGNEYSIDYDKAIGDITSILNNDDIRSDNKNCYLTYLNDTNSSEIIYITVNPYAYKSNNSDSISIPYTIITSQNYCNINYYNNSGTDLLSVQKGYIPGKSRLSPSLDTNRKKPYTFQGWSFQPNSNNGNLQSGDIIDNINNVNLYGVYYFGIKFDLNGGEGQSINPIFFYDNNEHDFYLPNSTPSTFYKSSTYNDNNITQIYVNRYNSKNEKIIINQGELCDGTSYQLKEWNMNKDESGTSFNLNTIYTVINGNYWKNGLNLLYAIWKEIPFIQQLKNPITIYISPNEQYLEGYQFLGYSTIKDSNIVEYSINNEYLISTTKDINLYPVFKRKFYFGKNREWKNCKLYYGKNNAWKEIVVYKGIEGKWK